MAQNDLIDVVETLIETCKDSEDGYKDAAQHVKDQQLRSQFLQYSAERGRFKKELEGELSKLSGASKKEEGSVGAAAHRAWMDLKANVGGGDKAVLNSVEQGEDRAKESYQKALQSSLSPQLETIVRRQSQAVIAAHNQVKSLRDGLAAA